MKVYRRRYLYLFLSCLICSLFAVFTAWEENFLFPSQMLLFVGFVIVFVAYLKSFKGRYKFSDRDLIFVLFAIGFVFRVVYVHSTLFYVRQHDVWGDSGHLDYIQRIYFGDGLPNEDFSTDFSQYYHPPLWHSICALWLRIQTWIGFTYKQAIENLQMLSLFCSGAIMLLSHKLFRLFNLRGRALVVACAIVAFHPTFIIFSASINNDVMSLTFALLSVIIAVKWYRNPRFKYIIPLAITIGISMATKLSGGLIALGVAMLFAVRLFGKEYRNKKSLVAQFASFGVICVPMALWWQIRNLVKFGIPITYVPELPKYVTQYIGFRSPMERIFDFSSLWENGVYPARITEGQAFEYFEHNIALGALKTSVFGEYYIGQGLFDFFAILLFWTAAVLALASVAATVYVVVRAIKNRKNGLETSVPEILMPTVCSATLFVSYVKFCFDYPFFCTMDFRYIALTVIIGSLYIGLLIKELRKNNKMFGRVLVIVLVIAVVLMSLSSMLLYGTIVRNA